MPDERGEYIGAHFGPLLTRSGQRCACSGNQAVTAAFVMIVMHSAHASAIPRKLHLRNR